MIVAIALAGGLGAIARFVVDGLARERLGPDSRLGIVLVNVTGSFAMGLLTGLVMGATSAEPLLAAAGTGFLGGYTTFSTAVVDALDRLRSGDRRTAVALALGTLVTSVAAALAGLALTGAA